MGAIRAAIPACFLAALLPAQQEPAELVLVHGEPPVLAAYGLGDGGVAAAANEGAAVDAARREERDGERTTRSGVRVQCAGAGVKLTFASGREVLFAPDGVLHLRTGEHAGPFPGGVELRLCCGAAIRILRSPAARVPVADVTLAEGDGALRLWRRGEPAAEPVRAAPWHGARLLCLGDGGALYRPLGLGPVVVFERVLVPVAAEKELPPVRAAVLATPLVRSLEALVRARSSVDARTRDALAVVAALADAAENVFAAAQRPLRVDHRTLRWALRGGVELSLALDGPSSRLALHAGEAVDPFVEWTLGATPAVWLLDPGRALEGRSRYAGNGQRLLLAGDCFAPRSELREVQAANALLRGLLGER